MQTTMQPNGNEVLLDVKSLTKHFPVRTGILQRISGWVSTGISDASCAQYSTRRRGALPAARSSSSRGYGPRRE